MIPHDECSVTTKPSACRQAPAAAFRICHVITRMIVGGAQENTLLTCRGLADRGHHVVLATGPTGGPEGKLLDNADLAGIDVVGFPDLRRAINPVTDQRAYRRLRDFFRDQRFDIVHTHSSKAGILGRLAARRAGCPLVLHTVHGQAFHQYETWWRNKLYVAAERAAAKRSDHIFAVAQAMIEQCVAANIAPRDRYSVVYSGMDVEAFATAAPDPGLRARLGIPPDAPVIGKIARLFELKGHDYLLQAAAELVATHGNVRFLLVGDGVLRPRLEARVRELGIAENVIFAGLVPPADIPRYVALMDILVHLSLREGLPRTVVQALAAGKPAVAFDLDGTPEVIRPDKTGILCAPGDVACIQASLDALLNAPGKARSLGRAGQDLVRKMFGWTQMVETLETAYRQLWTDKFA